MRACAHGNGGAQRPAVRPGASHGPRAVYSARARWACTCAAVARIRTTAPLRDWASYCGHCSGGSGHLDHKHSSPRWGKTTRQIGDSKGFFLGHISTQNCGKRPPLFKPYEFLLICHALLPTLPTPAVSYRRTRRGTALRPRFPRPDRVYLHHLLSLQGLRDYLSPISSGT